MLNINLIYLIIEILKIFFGELKYSINLIEKNFILPKKINSYPNN